MNTSVEKTLLVIEAFLTLPYGINPVNKIRILEEYERRWEKIGRRKLDNQLGYLERKGYIETKNKGRDSFQCRLTDKSIVKLLRNKLLFHYQSNKRTDEWQLVMFDVPEDRRALRNKARRILKELGFRELQKSVFIFPQGCEKELEMLVKTLKMEKYVLTGFFRFLDSKGGPGIK